VSTKVYHAPDLFCLTGWPTRLAEKSLYLRRFWVPFDALSYVFGRDPSYRLHQSWAAFSIATVKEPDAIPVHLVVDEKHSWAA